MRREGECRGERRDHMCVWERKCMLQKVMRIQIRIRFSNKKNKNKIFLESKYEVWL